MNGRPSAAAVLLVALVLWVPSLRLVLRGDLDTAAAAVRFGLSVALAWVFLAGVGRIVHGYRANGRHRPRPSGED